MILLDTHVVIWLALEPDRISKNARSAIDKARQTGEGLAVCGISLLEVTLLAGRKCIRFDTGLDSFLVNLERRFTILPISVQACVHSLSLPHSYPKDPADRIIAATALVEEIPLITADREIRTSRALQTIW